MNNIEHSFQECYNQIRALNLPLSLESAKDKTKSNYECKELASGYTQALALEMVTVLLAIAEAPISKPRLEWLAMQAIKSVTDILKRERCEKN